MSRPDPYAPWTEIDLSAIADNVTSLRRALRPTARLMVAVKADGYGHGAVPVADTALRHGAEALGVARLDEALVLRESGIEAPILVFGCAAPSLVEEFAGRGIAASVSGVAQAAAFAAGLRRGQILEVHLEVDTGMGRLGLLAQGGEAGPLARVIAEEVAAIRAIAGLRLAGIYTHFVEADVPGSPHPASQMRIFGQALALLEARGIRPPVAHAANSAAILRDPDTHFGMARAGLAVYGLDPFTGDRASLPLRPALALKGRVLHLKTVPSGATISYGRTWRAERPTVIATVPIGYGDGYPRALSNRGAMLVGGRRAPIVGRVCMDLTMLDVGGIPGVRVGDEVVAIGTQGGQSITADELAATLDTISYEVVTGFTPRVRRGYLPARAGDPNPGPVLSAAPVAC